MNLSPSSGPLGTPWVSLNASVLIRNTPSHHIFPLPSLQGTHFPSLQQLQCIRFIFGIEMLTFGEWRIQISALWMSVRHEAERRGGHFIVRCVDHDWELQSMLSGFCSRC